MQNLDSPEFLFQRIAFQLMTTSNLQERFSIEQQQRQEMAEEVRGTARVAASEAASEAIAQYLSIEQRQHGETSRATHRITSVPTVNQEPRPTTDTSSMTATTLASTAAVHQEPTKIAASSSSTIDTTTPQSIKTTSQEFPVRVTRPTFDKRIKIQDVWVGNPHLWLAHVELQLSRAGITDDAEKFYSVVEEFDEKMFSRMQQLINNPPTNEKWTTLKQNILREFAESQNERYDRVFRSLTMGDMRPSQLFDKISELAPQLPADLKYKLWIERLPESLRIHLLVIKLPLEQLVTVADDLFHNLRHFVTSDIASRINAVESNKVRQTRNNIERNRIRSPRPRSNSSNERRSSSTTSHDNSDLREEMNELRALFKRFLDESTGTCLQRSCSNARGRSSHRVFSPAGRGRSINRSNNNKAVNQDDADDFCYYHRRFGHDAQKCRPTCKHPSASKNE